MRTIVLDAGHGDISERNYDPGALNKNLNLTEAELNEKYVLAIKHFLSLDKNNKVIIVPKPSTVLERRRYVQELKPNCFLSIHMNASFDIKKRGYEIWYRYNYDFCKTIYTEMHEVMKEHSIGRGLRRDLDYGRRLGILATPINIPTCLVEVGFITNDEEASWLSKRETRVVIAQAIAKGITKYLESKETKNNSGNV